MYLTRRLAKRTKGMGLKLLKFHLILHLVEDILQFGVPLEFDTAANESHHKQAKKAACLTQRSADTFQFQMALRMIEFLMLELAMEEIKNGRVVWDYFDGAVEEGSDMEVDSSEGEVPESSEEQGEDEGEQVESSEENDECRGNQPMNVRTGETGIRVFRDGAASLELADKVKNIRRNRLEH